VFIAGAAVQWPWDGLKAIRTADELGELAQGVEDTGGVSMVPAFVGRSSACGTGPRTDRNLRRK
jgi:glycerol kinase